MSGNETTNKNCPTSRTRLHLILTLQHKFYDTFSRPVIVWDQPALKSSLDYTESYQHDFYGTGGWGRYSLLIWRDSAPTFPLLMDGYIHDIIRIGQCRDGLVVPILTVKTSPETQIVSLIANSSVEHGDYSPAWTSINSNYESVGTIAREN